MCVCVYVCARVRAFVCVSIKCHSIAITGNVARSWSKASLILMRISSTSGELLCSSTCSSQNRPLKILTLDRLFNSVLRIVFLVSMLGEDNENSIGLFLIPVIFRDI